MESLKAGEGRGTDPWPAECSRSRVQDDVSDDVLVERVRHDGDVGAYAHLVERYQASAVRLASLVTRDAAEAEDVAQEAFIKAFYALDRFRPGASFRPWLLRIVANEARNSRTATRRAARPCIHVFLRRRCWPVTGTRPKRPWSPTSNASRC